MDDVCIEGKRVSTFFLTGNTLVYDKPCWLLGITVYASVYGAYNLILYDDYDSAGEIKIKFRYNDTFLQNLVFRFPIYFSKGIYATFSSANQKVSLVFIQDKQI